MSIRNFLFFLVLTLGSVGECFAQISEQDVNLIKASVVDFEMFFGAVVKRCTETYPEHTSRLETSIHDWWRHNRSSVMEVREMYPQLTKYFPEADRTGFQATPKQLGNMMTGMLLDSLAHASSKELHAGCSGAFEQEILKASDFTALLNKIKSEK